MSSLLSSFTSYRQNDEGQLGLSVEGHNANAVADAASTEPTDDASPWLLLLQKGLPQSFRPLSKEEVARERSFTGAALQAAGTPHGTPFSVMSLFTTLTALLAEQRLGRLHCVMSGGMGLLHRLGPAYLTRCGTFSDEAAFQEGWDRAVNCDTAHDAISTVAFVLPNKSGGCLRALQPVLEELLAIPLTIEKVTSNHHQIILPCCSVEGRKTVLICLYEMWVDRTRPSSPPHSDLALHLDITPLLQQVRVKTGCDEELFLLPSKDVAHKDIRELLTDALNPKGCRLSLMPSHRAATAFHAAIALISSVAGDQCDIKALTQRLLNFWDGCWVNDHAAWVEGAAAALDSQLHSLRPDASVTQRDLYILQCCALLPLYRPAEQVQVLFEHLCTLERRRTPQQCDGGLTVPWQGVLPQGPIRSGEQLFSAIFSLLHYQQADAHSEEACCAITKDRQGHGVAAYSVTDGNQTLSLLLPNSVDSVDAALRLDALLVAAYSTMQLDEQALIELLMAAAKLLERPLPLLMQWSAIRILGKAANNADRGALLSCLVLLTTLLDHPSAAGYGAVGTWLRSVSDQMRRGVTLELATWRAAVRGALPHSLLDGALSLIGMPCWNEAAARLFDDLIAVGDQQAALSLLCHLWLKDGAEQTPVCLLDQLAAFDMADGAWTDEQRAAYAAMVQGSLDVVRGSMSPGNIASALQALLHIARHCKDVGQASLAKPQSPPPPPDMFSQTRLTVIQTLMVADVPAQVAEDSRSYHPIALMAGSQAIAIGAMAREALLGLLLEEGLQRGHRGALDLVWKELFAAEEDADRQIMILERFRSESTEGLREEGLLALAGFYGLAIRSWSHSLELTLHIYTAYNIAYDVLEDEDSALSPPLRYLRFLAFEDRHCEQAADEGDDFLSEIIRANDDVIVRCLDRLGGAVSLLTKGERDRSLLMALSLVQCYADSPRLCNAALKLWRRLLHAVMPTADGALVERHARRYVAVLGPLIQGGGAASQPCRAFLLHSMTPLLAGLLRCEGIASLQATSRLLLDLLSTGQKANIDYPIFLRALHRLALGGAPHSLLLEYIGLLERRAVANPKRLDTWRHDLYLPTLKALLHDDACRDVQRKMVRNIILRSKAPLAGDGAALLKDCVVRLLDGPLGSGMPLLFSARQQSLFSAAETRSLFEQRCRTLTAQELLQLLDEGLFSPWLVKQHQKGYSVELEPLMCKWAALIGEEGLSVAQRTVLLQGLLAHMQRWRREDILVVYRALQGPSSKDLTRTLITELGTLLCDPSREEDALAIITTLMELEAPFQHVVWGRALSDDASFDRWQSLTARVFNSQTQITLFKTISDGVAFSGIEPPRYIEQLRYWYRRLERLSPLLHYKASLQESALLPLLYRWDEAERDMPVEQRVAGASCRLAITMDETKDGALLIGAAKKPAWYRLLSKDLCLVLRHGDGDVRASAHHHLIKLLADDEDAEIIAKECLEPVMQALRGDAPSANGLADALLALLADAGCSLNGALALQRIVACLWEVADEPQRASASMLLLSTSRELLPAVLAGFKPCSLQLYWEMLANELPIDPSLDQAYRGHCAAMNAAEVADTYRLFQAWQGARRTVEPRHLVAIILPLAQRAHALLAERIVDIAALQQLMALCLDAVIRCQQGAFVDLYKMVESANEEGLDHLVMGLATHLADDKALRQHSSSLRDLIDVDGARLVKAMGILCSSAAAFDDLWESLNGMKEYGQHLTLFKAMLQSADASVLPRSAYLAELKRWSDKVMGQKAPLWDLHRWEEAALEPLLAAFEAGAKQLADDDQLQQNACTRASLCITLSDYRQRRGLRLLQNEPLDISARVAVKVLLSSPHQHHVTKGLELFDRLLGPADQPSKLSSLGLLLCDVKPHSLQCHLISRRLMSLLKSAMALPKQNYKHQAMLDTLLKTALPHLAVTASAQVCCQLIIWLNGKKVAKGLSALPGRDKATLLESVILLVSQRLCSDEVNLEEVAGQELIAALKTLCHRCEKGLSDRIVGRIADCAVKTGSNAIVAFKDGDEETLYDIVTASLLVIDSLLNRPAPPFPLVVDIVTKGAVFCSKMLADDDALDRELLLPYVHTLMFLLNRGPAHLCVLVTHKLVNVVAVAPFYLQFDPALLAMMELKTLYRFLVDKLNRVVQKDQRCLQDAYLLALLLDEDAPDVMPGIDETTAAIKQCIDVLVSRLSPAEQRSRFIIALLNASTMLQDHGKFFAKLRSRVLFGDCYDKLRRYIDMLQPADLLRAMGSDRRVIDVLFGIPENDADDTPELEGRQGGYLALSILSMINRSPPKGSLELYNYRAIVDVVDYYCTNARFPPGTEVVQAKLKEVIGQSREIIRFMSQDGAELI